MRAHRVIWAMFYGRWPAKDIDHINGDRTDNRISNLRHVSRAENARNSSRSSANTSGRTGVYKVKKSGKWNARIRVDGRFINLGFFKEFEAACAARAVAESKYGFSARHGSPRNH
ncbi:HNH endonuclease signature motif containing protein [Halocynthiibacter sp. C4]|uniref:HNH endonuclease signature motif containing protein n=1 Tax=Halocynthiibacter sp. C4 TaxID=2992758 RepID=UPI00406D2619